MVSLLSLRRVTLITLSIQFIVLWRAFVLFVAYSACRSTLRIAIAVCYEVSIHFVSFLQLFLQLTVFTSTVYIAVKIILSSRVSPFLRT